MEVVVKNNAFLGKETKRPSRFFREVSTIWAIFCREVSVALKSPGTLVMTLAMPLVMMVNMLFMVTSQGNPDVVKFRAYYEYTNTYLEANESKKTFSQISKDKEPL